MNFMGRWVPMEVVNITFLLWVIASVPMLGFIFWSFWCRRRKSRDQQAQPGARRRKKGVKR